MLINSLLFIICTLSFFAILFLFLTLVPYTKFFKDLFELRRKKLENEKINLIMKLDPKVAEEEINNFIKQYIDNYMISVFIINRIEYIKANEVEKMVRTIDKQILIDLSELYINYIKMLVNVSDEKDIIKFIDKKVKDNVLKVVTEYNKPFEK